MSWNDTLNSTRNRLRVLYKSIPEVTKGFGALSKAVKEGGVLDFKTKEFIALGIAVAIRAMETPLRAIVHNAGEEPSVILAKVKENSGNYGYNAANGEFGDMIAMGILDPTKVTRTALQAAVSIAALMITTEVMVAEMPEDKAAHSHGGGGMGDMGGMGGMGGMM